MFIIKNSDKPIKNAQNNYKQTLEFQPAAMFRRTSEKHRPNVASEFVLVCASDGRFETIFLKIDFFLSINLFFE